jgi:tRNA-dihydrouridine synthase 1
MRTANNPGMLLASAKLVEGECDAIDLNLGCPQRIAHAGHFGSYLLDPVDRPLILDIVKTVSKGES